jgi:hypothetical protein
MITRFLRIIFAIFCLLVVFILPKNKYEWMKEEGVTQLPVDENLGMYKLLSILPILCFLSIVLLIKDRKERIVFIGIGLCLGAFWTWKFLI